MPHLSAIPAFSTNYIWALYDEQQCVVVDPGQSGPVLNFLDAHGLRLSEILLTHHHGDHIGGVDALLQAHARRHPDAPPLPVTGPVDPRIPQITRSVGEDDRVSLNAWDISFNVLAVPGHTRTHIAFWNERWLFCGDTLFSAGCGRLFEGTPAQMQHSLDKLAALPGDLLVCCAHEYTLANCRFALQVEPDNTALQQRYAEATKLRKAGRITLPVPLIDELSYNPFLRSRAAGVVRAARQRAGNDQLSGAEPHQVLAVIRSWKDAA